MALRSRAKHPDIPVVYGRFPLIAMNQQESSPAGLPTLEVILIGMESLLAPSPPKLLAREVHVWEFPLTIPDSARAGLEKYLSDDELRRMRRFHAEQDRRRFGAAHGLLRSILGAYTGMPASELQFVISEYGKPRLANSNSKVTFNLSHSRERGLLGVTRDREVGVDIEAFKEDIEYEKLAKRFFSPHEQKALGMLPKEKQRSAFFRCWTCKEAFLKAQAVGLSRSLESFDIDLQSEFLRLAATRPDATEAERWSICEIDAGAEYAAAICAEGRVELIRFFQCEGG